MPSKLMEFELGWKIHPINDQIRSVIINYGFIRDLTHEKINKYQNYYSYKQLLVVPDYLSIFCYSGYYIFLLNITLF